MSNLQIAKKLIGKKIQLVESRKKAEVLNVEDGFLKSLFTVTFKGIETKHSYDYKILQSLLNDGSHNHNLD